MGTNYYLRKPMNNYCCYCNRHDPIEEIHLGKSSMGWCFGLHVYPEKDIYDWPDLKKWLVEEMKNNSIIVNEYNDIVSLNELEDIITNRESSVLRNFESSLQEKNFYAVNYALPGPRGLLRHQILKDHCISHGKGTWDCMVGSFS